METIFWLDELRNRLSSDGQFQFKIKGSRLQQGICPGCGQKEVFGNLEKPFFLQCNRKNKCGWSEYSKKLYPDLLQNLAQKAPATRQNPNATADAYLQSRGFSLKKWQGCSQQKQIKIEDDQGTRHFPGVQFSLSGGAKWSRVIDYQGKQKAYFHGSYKGQVWVPPGMEIFGEIFLVEGIFEAMSLVEHGHKAVAILSATHLPDGWLEQYRHVNVEWKIAFNWDDAGLKGAKKLKQWMLAQLGKESELAFPPKGKDWNDLFNAGVLGEPALLEDSLFRGRLSEATTEQQYYEIWQERIPGKHLFEFDNQTWHGTPSSGDKPAEVRPVANFTLALQYCQCEESNPESPNRSYVFQCTDHRGKKQTARFSAEELSTASLFKTASLKRLGGVWSGAQNHLDQLLRRESMKNHHSVRLLTTNGYDKISDCYIFEKVAYDKHGNSFQKNADQFFEIGTHNLSLLSVEPNFPLTHKHSLADWYPDFVGAYGYKGLSALGFYVASLFAEQFFQKSGFFPFLSLYKDPATGKSTLWGLLNTLFGRDIPEGLPTSKINTAKGEIRKIATLSNLPLAILEANDSEKARFDFSMLLTLFNRLPLQVRAQTSNDLSTLAIEFKGTLVFIWNREQFEDRAIKERVLSVPFPKSEISPQTREHADRLTYFARHQPDVLSGFRHLILSNRQAVLDEFLKTWKELALTMQAQRPVITDRIASVHALAFAGWFALKTVLPSAYIDTHQAPLESYLMDLAEMKERSLTNENDFLSHFFEVVESLIEANPELNHSRDPSCLRLSLPEMESACREAGHSSLFSNIRELRKNIMQSSRYLDNGSKWSPKKNKKIRVFDFSAN